MWNWAWLGRGSKLPRDLREYLGPFVVSGLPSAFPFSHSVPKGPAPLDEGAAAHFSVCPWLDFLTSRKQGEKGVNHGTEMRGKGE